MDENKIVNNILTLLKESTVEKAYEYLIETKNNVQDVGVMIYHFLYWLAALCNREEEALNWLEEAIVEKGLWYRTKMFDDEALNSIRNTERFKACFEISEGKYQEAKKNSKPEFTWKSKEDDKIAIALHGNTQNIEMCMEQWSFLSEQGYQIEYLQSPEIYAYDLYRWELEGTGPTELSEAISACSWNEYKEQILCGFKAACNVILKAILNKNVRCSTIILQNPWMPMINKELDEIVHAIKEANINVFILCDKMDEKCFPLSETFYNAAHEYGIPIKKMWTDNSGHDFPENFNEIVEGYLKQLK